MRPKTAAEGFARRILGYFFRGLVFLTPVVITAYVVVVVFKTIDGWLGLPIPGAGFAVSLAVITLFGFLASSFLTRSLITALDDLLERLPFVRLLYSSTRDLVNAFVGEKRRFDKPVVVDLFPGGNARALGFVTQDALNQLDMPGHVSVYMPHSYNFSGQMYLFPTSAVTRLDTNSSDMMAFIVSGGVTEIPVLARPAAPRADGDDAAPLA
ncbi:MAG TPA: DUF502 domain-containing protein [Gemmatimonadaceae bacterium]|nr:MAG: hypothetical protein ABS52_14560 [Gemmatimonadetes bacterium SCN 70-22]HMN07810.1 DUF502 domain-containing protein [Gemmatimonadaceae bacterium]